MKRTISVITLLIATVITLNAQNWKDKVINRLDFRRNLRENGFKSPGMLGESQTLLMSNHSLSATLIGVEYSYEQPVYENISVIGRLGLQPNGLNINYSHKFSECDFSCSTLIGATIETRLYTTVVKRARQGSNIYMNSGDFISLKFSAGDGFKGGWDVSLTPLYGTRRVLSSHLFHEFSIGPSFGYIRWKNYYYCSPYIQYRIGYIF